MGNDDVICLSSDDETTPVQTPGEKFKGVAEPVKSEADPSPRRPVNLKRRGSAFNESKQPPETKKPKVASHGPEQDVNDSLPVGSTNQVTKSTPSAKKVNLTLPRCIRKSTGQAMCIRKSTGQAVGFNPRNSDSLKLRTAPGIPQSQVSRSRPADHGETLSNKTKVVNPEPRDSRSKQSSQSPTHLDSKNESSLHNGSKTLEDKKKTEKTIAKPAEKIMPPGEKTKTPAMDRIREEFHDLPNIKITPIGTSSKASVAKHQEKATPEAAKLPEPNRRSSGDKNPRSQSTNNTPKIICTKSENLRKIAEEFERLVERESSGVDRNIAEASSSPEIVIVEGPESSKTGSTGSDNKVNGKSEKPRSSVESSGRTSNGQKSEPQKSLCSTTTSSSKEENNVCKDIEHVSSSRKDPPGTQHKLRNSGGDGSKTDESFGKESSQSKSIPKASRASVDGEKIDVSKKLTRITPLQLNKPKSNGSLKDFPFSKNPNTTNSRLSTSSESENEKRSKEPFEPVAGCSKTPDVVIWTEPKKKKHRASPDSSFMTTPWQAQETNEAVEKPETLQQHKNSLKPHLVVKTKEPASVEQDTFAMFLSLCLQVERSPEMEKIVAKLKRNYDQLDPVYSRSRMFSDFLNDIREKILAKGRIYSYISRVADEMKFRRKKAEAPATKNKKEETNVPGTKETDGKVESSTEVNDDHEDRRESRRLQQKIKTIEMAMRKCAKRIQQYEVAEVDLDADDNSNYIKMERYKSKMVELYTKLCEYTHEHPDAGRSYLRPKHLRVTQIPSIDQAINSFINSKLSYNRKKSGKSFVDGLIFPDYVDILECVGKVNDEQKLGLDKRRQQALAKEAFTELGKKLQGARQRDYWDTFSEHLEQSDDPAAADPTLAEKLLENKKIAEKNTAEIFEEYVRKQEQRSETDHESTNSESGHEEEEDEEEDDEEDSEKTDRIVSDVELSDTEDVPSSGENEKEKNASKTPEPIPEAERECETLNDADDVAPEIEENSGLENDKKTIENSEKMPIRTEKTLVTDKPIAVNHVEDGCEEVIEILEQVRPEVEKPQEKMDKESLEEVGTAKKKQKEESLRLEMESDKASPEKSSNIESFPNKTKDSPSEANGSVRTEAPEIEVNHAETDTEEATSVIEQPKVLRIRSFAKPPSSWASSQPSNGEDAIEAAPDSETRVNAETIDLLDDEPENGASKVTKSPEVVSEPRPSLTTTIYAESSKKEKLVVEVSEKVGETTLSVKTNRSTIVIRSPNKSSPNQLPRITKRNPNQGQSVQNKKAIGKVLPSCLGQSESFKNRLDRDPSVQTDKAVAPIYKTSQSTGPFPQIRPQQCLVQRHVAVARSSNKSPERNRFHQIRLQKNIPLQKQTAEARNGRQQSSQIQKKPATILQSPRESQSIKNLQQQQSLSSQKPIATSGSPTTLSANIHPFQNRVQQTLPDPKLVTTPKRVAGPSHQNSSMPNSSRTSQAVKLSPANIESLRNCFVKTAADLLALKKASTAGAGAVKASPNASHQTTTTEKVRTQNIAHNLPLQDELINLVNRRVFSLDSPQSIEIKSVRKAQNFSSLDKLKSDKSAMNNNQNKVNSNIPKVNNDNNNNKKNEKPRETMKNLPSANTSQNSSAWQTIAKLTNPIRPARLQPVPQKLDTNPSNSQPLVKLRVAPYPQTVHSVQQQLINVSKVTIRPLGVRSIQAQGITLKNPRLIELPEQQTMPPAAARAAAYPRIQNPLQKTPQSANCTNSYRAPQGNPPTIIQRTNYVLKPLTSNNTPPPNPQQQQNFKLSPSRFIRTPQNNTPPPNSQQQQNFKLSPPKFIFSPRNNTPPSNPQQQQNFKLPPSKFIPTLQKNPPKK